MGRKPAVPSTISDKKMADLRSRAAKADREDWTSARAVRRRLAANANYAKRAAN
jgi:hypothetical protein